jgi:hypothetical protein
MRQALVFQISHEQSGCITERQRIMSNPNPRLAGTSSSGIASPVGTGAGRSGRPAPAWFLWVGGLALAAYLCFLAAHMTAVAGGSDSSGYLNSARLLAAGRLQTDLRVPAELAPLPPDERLHFAPAGFNLFPGNPHLAPSYPSGLPLHLALAGRLLGWQAGPFILQLLVAIGTVWLCYLIARELGIGWELAAAGAALLAAFPVFIFTSIQTLSDTLATTWTLLALLCGIYARRSAGWAVACGASLAVAVLVRPTNVVIAPALLVLVGADVRRLGVFVLGGLPGAAWLAFYNHELYGGALRSGYGNIGAEFGLRYFVPTVIHFAKWLALLLPSVVLALPFAALLQPDTRGRGFLALALVFAAIVGVYLFYSVSHDVWWCLRFILPASAALILLALLGIEALARGPGSRWPRGFRPAVAIVLAGWAAAGSWYWTRNLHVLYVPQYETAYADAGRAVQERFAPDALVVCSAVSGMIYYYTDMPTLVYDSLEPGDFARYVARVRQAGRPIHAVLFDIEEEDALQNRCPGLWTKLTAVGNIGLWQLQ